MTDAAAPQDPLAGASPEEITSALFANLVLQQANMALMFLGQVAHPQSGKAVTDLEAARMFIGQLEMLETKTKGNLSAHEAALLKQSLTSARMAFVEAVDRKEPPGDLPPGTPPTAPDPAAAGGEPQTQAPPGGETEADSRKKFTKRY